MFFRPGCPGPEARGEVIIQARHQARVAAAFQGGGLVEVIALAGVYLVAARAGLSLAAEGSHISAVWLPSGVALGGLLLWGVSRWPAVFLGAWTVALSLDVPPGVGLGVAAGATLEAVLGALLLRRVACSRELHRVRDVVWL
ncbi:histidine kinase, partial [Corallococcus sp. CA047B]